MKRIVAFAALGAVLAACTQTTSTSTTATSTADQSSAAAQPRNARTQAGVLRVAIQQDVKNLNPLLTSNTTDVMIADLMFEQLTHADPKGNPVPMLAREIPTTENGGISKDGLTFTYHLRKNVKWTDGVPVTSKDVKWSWQAIMNPNNNIVSRHGYDTVSSIDTPDDSTAVVHLKTKFAPFVNTFFADSDQPFPVAPAHILSKYPNINQIPFTSAPTVSDGAFKFVKWAHGDHIELAANPAYYQGAPKLNKIIIKIIPDENTAVNLARTHDIDWMFESSIRNYNAVKDIPGTRLFFVDVNGYEDVQLNISHPLLKDVRVRQAIAYAIDKQRLIDTLTFGQEKMAVEDQPHFMWTFNPNVKQYPHDLSKAKQLLQQAGYTPGSDGIMQKNGQRLSLVLVYNTSNVTRRQASIQIQGMLKEAGIDLAVKTYPGNVLFAPAGEGGILQLGNFDLSLAGWFSGVDPDDSSQFGCKNFPPGGYNYPRYCNPDMEKAQQLALGQYDQASRKADYYKIQELLARDVPEIFFWDLRQMHVISNDFKGFDPNPVTESWNSWQWSI
ncbi:MAG: peptide ABC transporter substrate-binding protein [Candidatus Eremiobacteraeota bacterium]|nr:peptide ABC transporter substrate-binding protein [Candidatus Eremiobacteraeota bacterium]